LQISKAPKRPSRLPNCFARRPLCNTGRDGRGHEPQTRKAQRTPTIGHNTFPRKSRNVPQRNGDTQQDIPVCLPVMHQGTKHTRKYPQLQATLRRTPKHEEAPRHQGSKAPMRQGSNASRHQEIAPTDHCTKAPRPQRAQHHVTKLESTVLLLLFGGGGGGGGGKQKKI